MSSYDGSKNFTTVEELRNIVREEFERINQKNNPQNKDLPLARVGDRDVRRCPICGEFYPTDDDFNHLTVYDFIEPNIFIKHCKKEECTLLAKLSQTKHLIDCLRVPYWFNSCLDKTKRYNTDTHGESCVTEIRWSRTMNKPVIRFESKGEVLPYSFCRTYSEVEALNPGAVREILSSVEWPEFYPTSLKEAFFEQIP